MKSSPHPGRDAVPASLIFFLIRDAEDGVPTSREQREAFGLLPN